MCSPSAPERELAHRLTYSKSAQDQEVAIRRFRTYLVGIAIVGGRVAFMSSASARSAPEASSIFMRLLSGLEPRHDEKGTAYRDNVFQGGDHEVGSLEGAYQTCANLVTRKRAGDSARHAEGGAESHGLRP